MTAQIILDSDAENDWSCSDSDSEDDVAPQHLRPKVTTIQKWNTARAVDPTAALTAARRTKKRSINLLELPAYRRGALRHLNIST